MSGLLPRAWVDPVAVATDVVAHVESCFLELFLLMTINGAIRSWHLLVQEILIVLIRETQSWLLVRLVAPLLNVSRIQQVAHIDMHVGV